MEGPPLAWVYAMIGSCFCSVYKDWERFSWCHEHPPSPTLSPKLPTSTHPEAEAAFLAIAACHPPPPLLRGWPCLLCQWLFWLRLVRVWSSKTWSCLPLERRTPPTWTQKPVQSWDFCSGSSSPNTSPDERWWCNRSAGTSRRWKQEGGAMRGKVTMSLHVKRQWQQQGDAITSRGELEGGASRGNVITSVHIERWWHSKKWHKDNQSNVTTSWHVEEQRHVKRWHKVA
jgi:hypothetical protein